MNTEDFYFFRRPASGFASPKKGMQATAYGGACMPGVGP